MRNSLGVINGSGVRSRVVIVVSMSFGTETVVLSSMAWVVLKWRVTCLVIGRLSSELVDIDSRRTFSRLGARLRRLPMLGMCDTYDVNVNLPMVNIVRLLLWVWAVRVNAGGVAGSDAG